LRVEHETMARRFARFRIRNHILVGAVVCIPGWAGGTMNVLIACEFSGVVRDAFLTRGHNAISCDILPTDSIGPHYQCDVMDIVNDGFDLMIAHPPCTHLCVSGARHFPTKIADGRQQQGIDFFMALANADIPRLCIENPVGIMSTVWRKPDQYIQPWQFGDPFSKKTGLWLKNLPLLTETNVVDRGEKIIYASGRIMPKWYSDAKCLPAKECARVRSRTFQGIADAMASQWGNL